ncbi:DoxX family protein [Owenweeksia hongkongensis]|uniref:DoxX family protein n=1 Tax=Owenweeksia hongkongensis TaxID=253245 RepID=UPI003A92DA54
MNIDLGKLLLRLGFGGLMIPHGVSKLQNLLSGSPQFANVFGIGEIPSLILAILAELACPILIILGIKTRLFSIPVVITMAVAAFVIHGGDPWGKKEMALLYLVGYTAIALVGSGSFAVNKNS